MNNELNEISNVDDMLVTLFEHLLSFFLNFNVNRVSNDETKFPAAGAALGALHPATGGVL
jgi:hypothetical protein